MFERRRLRIDTVVAIVADADMLCISCAEILYGKEKVQAFIECQPGYEEWCRDHEGNVLGAVLADSLDLHTMYCGGCGVPLCDEYCPCYACPSLWQEYRVIADEGMQEEYTSSERIRLGDEGAFVEGDIRAWDWERDKGIAIVQNQAVYVTWCEEEGGYYVVTQQDIQRLMGLGDV
ncbi:hypothetical protein EI42_06127 [Thermosporothrix hazakensis]|jgi:hypothetical protein|uniref:Uncharacterized protein n=1 Tax=Thermosporothrix hazakensis TaxID=644383 RepID=A0A326TV67_THEHA|nr:hypothetical protein [Thermosporothrix hazakensis]PZW19314.1 hypothetical protein EI42_06127 [Thermosporothrix hazakensis]GCE48247.1 hypothetical protein KTH_31160 [Thermosporothrix hazakensis]